MQSFLKLQNITPDNANFSENFLGPGGPKLCPLCSTYLDNQQMSFRCPEILPPFKEKGKYEGLF